MQTRCSSFSIISSEEVYRQREIKKKKKWIQKKVLVSCICVWCLRVPRLVRFTDAQNQSFGNVPHWFIRAGGCIAAEARRKKNARSDGISWNSAVSGGFLRDPRGPNPPEYSPDKIFSRAVVFAQRAVPPTPYTSLFLPAGRFRSNERIYRIASNCPASSLRLVKFLTEVANWRLSPPPTLLIAIPSTASISPLRCVENTTCTDWFLYC